MKTQMSPSTPKSSPLTTSDDLIRELRRIADARAVSGRTRFGIQTQFALGIPVPQLRRIASRTRPSHELALQLWNTGVHEARLLAGMIDEPRSVTVDQMEKWAADFNSWDLVDGTCGNLFDKTEFAEEKALEWSKRPEEYIKRAGFVLMAELAVHDKIAPNKTFLGFLPLIVREASDERNFVKKAVNWALRQIGKRNAVLRLAAIRTAKAIRSTDSTSAKWIANDALRELESDGVRKKLGLKGSISR